jgi:hypothetical protein
MKNESEVIFTSLCGICRVSHLIQSEPDPGVVYCYEEDEIRRLWHANKRLQKMLDERDGHKEAVREGFRLAVDSIVVSNIGKQFEAALVATMRAFEAGDAFPDAAKPAPGTED